MAGLDWGTQQQCQCKWSKSSLLWVRIARLLYMLLRQLQPRMMVWLQCKHQLHSLTVMRQPSHSLWWMLACHKLLLPRYLRCPRTSLATQLCQQSSCGQRIMSCQFWMLGRQCCTCISTMRRSLHNMPAAHTLVCLSPFRLCWSKQCAA